MMSDCYSDYQRYATLKPYPFRLMMHFAATNVCFESTEQLAAACNMSEGAVVKHRAALLEAGYITITPMTPAELAALGWLDQPTSDTNEVFVVTPVHHRKAAPRTHQMSAAREDGAHLVSANRDSGTHQMSATRDDNAPATPKGIVPKAAQNGNSSLGVHHVNQVFNSLKEEAVESVAVPPPSIKAKPKTAQQQRLEAFNSVYDHPLWQAFVRGWDGITPGLATRQLPDVQAALVSLEAQGISTADIEGLTRQKVKDPNRKTEYRFTYLPEDLPPYLAQKRAAAPKPVVYHVATPVENPLPLEERRRLAREGREEFRRMRLAAAGRVS